jgi:PAS domain S-box-containing protein
MNGYALSSLAASALAGALGLLAISRDPRAPLNRAFFGYALCMAWWAFTEAGMRQADDFAEADLWRRLGSAWPFTIAFLGHFALLFAERSRSFTRVGVGAVLYGPALAVTVLEACSDLVSGPPVRQYWGWTYIPAESLATFLVSDLWAVCVAFGAAVVCILRHRTADASRDDKKRAEYVAVGVLLPVALGFTSEFLLPALGRRVPEMTATGFAAGAVFLFIAMWRHRLFRHDLAAAADDVVATMSDALLVTDLAGTIVLANQAALDTLGCRRDQLVGRPLDVLFAPDERCEFARRWIEPVASGARLRDREATFVGSGCRRVPVALSSAAVFPRRGSDGALVFVARDLTEQRQAEEARILAVQSAAAARSAAATVEALEDGVVLVGGGGRVVAVNLAFERLSGVAAGAARGDRATSVLRSVVPPAERARLEEAVAAALSGEMPPPLIVGDPAAEDGGRRRRITFAFRDEAEGGPGRVLVAVRDDSGPHGSCPDGGDPVRPLPGSSRVG